MCQWSALQRRWSFCAVQAYIKCTNGQLDITDGVFAPYRPLYSDERLLITHCHSGAINLSVPENIMIVLASNGESFHSGDCAFDRLSKLAITLVQPIADPHVRFINADQSGEIDGCCY